ncbi:hypothetical protein QCA50_001024 [Cerrena zonata]|uniref:Uncharacterized protein n=1 Tax=Cerrena zonata TaxID=2478898 RepID=A0AAW0H0E1_9APHY
MNRNTKLSGSVNSTSTDRYVVYMPGNQSLPYPFHLPKVADVFDLETQIRQSPAFKSIMDSENPGGIHLLKFGKMDITMAEEMPNNINKWFQRHLADARMQPSRLLRKYFPSGPAPRESETIDIIAVTDKILNMYASEPSPQESEPIMIGPPKRKAPKRVEKVVEVTLKQEPIDPELRVEKEREMSRQTSRKKNSRDEREQEERDPATRKLPPKVGTGREEDPIEINDDENDSEGLAQESVWIKTASKREQFRIRRIPCTLCRKGGLRCLVLKQESLCRNECVTKSKQIL